MNRILRFDGATANDAEIDAWLTKQPDELHAIAQKWFGRMRKCGNDVQELMHDGCPTACIEDAGFGYVNIFKDHVIPKPKSYYVVDASINAAVTDTLNVNNRPFQ